MLATLDTFQAGLSESGSQGLWSVEFVTQLNTPDTVQIMSCVKSIIRRKQYAS